MFGLSNREELKRVAEKTESGAPAKTARIDPDAPGTEPEVQPARLSANNFWICSLHLRSCRS